MAKNELTLKLIKLDDAVALTWADNPKLHDSEEIIASLQKYGFQDPPKYDSALAAIIGGNGRIEALATMRDSGLEPVAGLALTKKGEWCLPVLFGNDLADKAQAEAFALDSNNLTMAGGYFDAEDMARMWDSAGYNALLSRLRDQEALPVSVTEQDLELLLAEIEDTPETEPAPKKKPEEEGDPEPAGQADTVVRIGDFGFKLERAQYFALIEGIRQENGFDEPSIHRTIKARLGLLAYEVEAAATEAAADGD